MNYDKPFTHVGDPFSLRASTDAAGRQRDLLSSESPARPLTQTFGGYMQRFTLPCGELTERIWEPIRPELARHLVYHQSALRVPLKLFIKPDGVTGAMLEHPRSAQGVVAEELAADALSLLCSCRPGVALPQESTLPAISRDQREHINNALALLGWENSMRGDNSIAVVPRLGGSMRPVFIEQVTPFLLRLRLSRQTLPINGSQPVEAMTRFVLEANWWFRLARVSLSKTPDMTILACWDFILAVPVPLGKWLAHSVSSLFAAARATQRALRALTNPAVAKAYLAGCRY